MKNLYLKLFKPVFSFVTISAFFVQTIFAQTNLIENGDFENGTTNWAVWSAAMATTSDAHSGKGAVKISNRKNPWDAIVTDVTSIIENGQTYTLSAWVKITDPAVNFRATLQLNAGGTTTYTGYIGSNNPTIGTYALYSQTFTLNWTGNLVSANLYFETDAVNDIYSDYILDDVILVKSKPIIEQLQEGQGWKDIKSTLLIGGCATESGQNYWTNPTAKAQLLKDCNTVTVQCYPGWGRWDDTLHHVYHVDEFSNRVKDMKKEKMTVTAHMLLGWDQYFPAWYKQNDFPSDTLEAIMKSWLKGIISYQGNDTLVDVWNVVNEAISWNGKGGYWPLYNANFNDACELQRMGMESDASDLTGADFVNAEHPVYIRKAFEYARTLTKKKLELRDSGFEFPDNGPKYNAFYQLAVHLKKVNAPVDIIGFQTHIDLERNYDWDAYTNNIKRYVKLGYEVIIPEVDIGDKAKSWSDEKAELQKKQYYNLITAAIRGGASDFQTWGFIDDGWRPGEKAFPYSSSFERKPAYYGIEEALIDMSSILFWEMDEAVNDTIPDVMKYNNFGTMKNFNTPVFVPGFKKNALQFDGVDDFIAIDNLSEKITGDFTFSCFIKTSSTEPSVIALFSSEINLGFDLGINANGKIYFGGAEVREGGVLEGTSAVNDGVWHFVAIQRDSIKYRLYVDDYEPISIGQGQIIDINSLVLGINSFGADHFEGLIDEVKLYESAIEEASFTRSFKIQEQVILDAKYSRMIIKLTWTDKTKEKTGFIIDRKIGDGNWEVAKEVSANVFSYVDNVELYDTTYQYRIRSASRFENSGTSNVVEVKTPNDPNTGIQNVNEKTQLLVYPNPVHDKFNLITTENLWMKIYDMQGNLVLQKNKCAPNETIDIREFKNGVYFVYSCSNEKISVAKLVKN
jgi:GH35 family endo-1,4-beta-xylanase